jgi:hypothetical protein
MAEYEIRWLEVHERKTLVTVPPEVTGSNSDILADKQLIAEWAERNWGEDLPHGPVFTVSTQFAEVIGVKLVGDSEAWVRSEQKREAARNGF